MPLALVSPTTARAVAIKVKHKMKKQQETLVCVFLQAVCPWEQLNSPENLGFFFSPTLTGQWVENEVRAQIPAPL